MEPTPRTSLDDRVHEALARDDVAAAATAAIRELGPAVLRYLRSVLRGETDAGDAFSLFAEDLWEGLPGFRGESTLRTWAYRLAWRAALRVRGEGWRRRRQPLSFAATLAKSIRTSTPARLEQRSRALDALRAGLSLREQSLLSLRIDQGLSWAEISHVLAEEGEQVDTAALMKRFQRLKDRLGAAARKMKLLE